MKCAHPLCSRHLGMLTYRTGKRLFCSKACRDDHKRMQREEAERDQRVWQFLRWLRIVPP